MAAGEAISCGPDLAVTQRFIARIPALLMLATLTLCAVVALAEVQDGSRLVAAAPLAVVQTPPYFVLYFDYSQLGAGGRVQAV